MNFVSNCQFFSLERCNKAHWDPAFLTNKNLGSVDKKYEKREKDGSLA